MQKNGNSRVSLTDEGLIHVSGSRSTTGELSKEELEGIVRQASERGHTDWGWLKSYHSFSFGDYYDQRHMGFRSLRVINDDRIAAGRGFPTHPHRDMEIISYVLEGALQHRDSTGRGAIVTPDDIQMMSAGTGITHSEYNPSKSESNHFLQIWIEPAVRGVQPQYSDNQVTLDQKLDQWKRIAGPDGSNAAVSIHQDATIYATHLTEGKSLDFTLERDRHGWLQVARGSLMVHGTILRSGDAMAISQPMQLHIQAIETTDALLFDLA